MGSTPHCQVAAMVKLGDDDTGFHASVGDVGQLEVSSDNFVGLHFARLEVAVFVVVGLEEVGAALGMDERRTFGQGILNGKDGR